MNIDDPLTDFVLLDHCCSCNSSSSSSSSCCCCCCSRRQSRRVSQIHIKPSVITRSSSWPRCHRDVTIKPGHGDPFKPPPTTTTTTAGRHSKYLDHEKMVIPSMNEWLKGPRHSDTNQPIRSQTVLHPRHRGTMST